LALGVIPRSPGPHHLAHLDRLLDRRAPGPGAAEPFAAISIARSGDSTSTIRSFASGNGPSVTTGAPTPSSVTIFARLGPGEGLCLDKLAVLGALVVEAPLEVDVSGTSSGDHLLMGSTPSMGASPSGRAFRAPRRPPSARTGAV
jgi:hypothetical protein